MPFKVPRKDELPTAPNALPGVRVGAAPTAAQLGGNARVPTDFVGAGLASAGKAFGAIAQDMQDREDTDLIMRAEVARDDALRAKQAEWAERRGVNAWNVTKDAHTWWDEDSVKFAEGLNERQRSAYYARQLKVRDRSLDVVSNHERTERHASQAESAKAKIGSQINAAIDNPAAADDAAREIGRVMAVQAKLRGWDADTADFQRGEALSTLHTRVVESLVAKSPEAARAYFDARKHEISAANRAKVEDALKAGTTLRKAQTVADTLEAEGVTEAEGLKRIRAELTGDDEKVAVAEWRGRFAEQDAAQTRLERDALDRAMEQYTARGRLTDIDPNLVRDMGGRNWLSLQKEHESILASRESRAAARENRAAASEQRQWTVEQRRKEREGYGTFNDLWERGTSANPEERRAFADVNLLEYADRLPRDRLDSLRTLQANIRKGDGNPEVLDAQAVSRGVKVAADQWKWTGAKHADKRGALTEAVNAEVMAQQAREGRKLKQTEINAIAAELARSGSVEGGSFFGLFDDDEVPRFQVIGTENESRWRPGGKKGPQPRAAIPASGGAKIPTVTTAQQMQALPKGAQFRDANGKLWIR